MSKALKYGSRTPTFLTSWRHPRYVCSTLRSLARSHRSGTSFTPYYYPPLRPRSPRSQGLVLVGRCQWDLALCTYLSRPVTPSGERVTPPDLWEYRYTNQFKAPCCLCACTLGGTYTESVIYQALDGPYTGEFICGCASFRCGFLSTYTLLFQRRLRLSC